VGEAPPGNIYSIYFSVLFSNILMLPFICGGPLVGIISSVTMMGVLQCGQMPG